jgi:hypothetical protein
MSQENVELVRRMFWAFDNDADEWQNMLSPELVWFPVEDNHTPSYGIVKRHADQGSMARRLGRHSF